MQFFIRNYVEGLFLSSGVAGNADAVMGKMLETVRLIREQHKFQGYIHLKVLPGVNRDLVKQASKLADRLSINVEAPNKSRFSELTSTKNYKTDVLRRIMWLKKLNLPAGFTTQYVVGAAGESDKELINMSAWLYEKAELRRAYYSAFIPVKKTPLEKGKPTPLVRENMLYRVDWLMRKYDYAKKEVFHTLNENGNLSLKKDPKTVIAEKTLGIVDLSNASYDRILRIPGIGVRNAKRIVSLRRSGISINSLKELKAMGSAYKRALPFVKIGGEAQSRLTHWNT
jgi:predicted DNA-binding helix-hairpin-helix protein